MFGFNFQYCQKFSIFLKYDWFVMGKLRKFTQRALFSYMACYKSCSQHTEDYVIHQEQRNNADCVEEIRRNNGKIFFLKKLVIIPWSYKEYSHPNKLAIPFCFSCAHETLQKAYKMLCTETNFEIYILNHRIHKILVNAVHVQACPFFF